MEIKYKDSTNKVHQIEEGYEHLLPTGCVPITDVQAAAILNPPLTLTQIKTAASADFQAQIDAIEAVQRTAIREAVLNKQGAMARLTLIDNQVAALRMQKAAL